MPAEVAVHRPIERVGADDLRRRDVPERPLDDGPRLAPGRAAVVAGDDLEVAVASLLHKHQQLAVDDERTPFFVGQRGQVGPGRAAVGAADDPQRPPNVRASSAPLWRRHDQCAVVEPGEVRVVEEIALGIRDTGRDHELLR